jgi:hypothetical protein
MSLIRRSDSGLAKHFFDTPAAFAIGNPRATQDQRPRGFASTPSLIYTSYSAFARDVKRGRIEGAMSAVVYDPERWAATPRAEQRHPIRYVRRFARLAHLQRFFVMAAPGRDLVQVRGGACTRRAGQTNDEAYLACRIPARCARYVDGFVIQGQADEIRLRRFARLVRGASRQARALEPHILVLAELSTGPPTGTPSPLQLTRAAKATARMVSGYWLGIFASRDGHLSTAIRFLKRLRRSGY